MSCLVLSCLVLSCKKIEDYFGIDDIKEDLSTIEEENEEQKEKIKTLEERVSVIEDFLKNYQTLQEQIISLSKTVDDNYETLTAEIKNCGYDDTEIVNSLNNLRENITAEKIELQDKLLSAFADNEEILNKTVKDLSEDIKKLENIVKEKNDTEELKNEIITLSNRIDAIKQVDLITTENGFIYYWNNDKKLLAYQSNKYFAYFYYYDNGGFSLYVTGKAANNFYYVPNNKFVRNQYIWYCYEHDLILVKKSQYDYIYTNEKDCCESDLRNDKVKVELKDKNNSLLTDWSYKGYDSVPNLVKNYMIDYCSLPLEHY